MPEQGNILAQLALILWVPISLGLFAVLRPAPAAAVCLLGANILLPVRIGFDFPGLPLLDAERIAGLSAILGCLIFHPDSLRGKRPGLGLEALVGVLALEAFVTALTNRDPVSRGPDLASSHDNLRRGVAGRGPDPDLRRSVLSRARPRPATDTGPCAADHSRGGGADLFVADPLGGSHEPAAARHRLRLQPAPVDADDSFRRVETDGFHGARSGPCAVRAHHESRRGRALETGAPHPAEASRAGCSLSDGHPGAVQEPGDARLWGVHPADRSLRATANPAPGGGHPGSLGVPLSGAAGHRPVPEGAHAGARGAGERGPRRFVEDPSGQRGAAPGEGSRADLVRLGHLGEKSNL